LRPEKILLVNEDPDQGALAAWLLKTALPAAEILEVRDQEALEEALSSASYDLVLTDNHFSWGNGMRVLSLVRRYLPGCPVVMLTGHGSEEIACEALKKGFADYLPATSRGYLVLGKRVRSVLAGGGQIAASGLIAQYERLLELLDEAVFLATRDGLLLQVNSAFSRLMKCTNPETVRGRRLADFLQADPLLGFLEELDPKGEPRTAQVPLKEAADTVRLRACLVSQGDRLPTILVGRIQARVSASPPSRESEENHRVVDQAETDAPGVDNVDLEKVLDLVLTDLRPVVEHAKVKIVRGNLPAIEGSHLDMVRLFQNLLSSIIRLRTRETLEIDITAHRMPVEWLFVVKVSGSRIVEADLGSGSPEHPADEQLGPGKGLTVCRRIVERHGGRLWVTSESEAGSSLYFTLASEDRTQQEQVDGSRAGN
jgi:signal transduction histidine kinase